MRNLLFLAAIMGMCLVPAAWAASGEGVIIRSNSLQIEERTGDIRFEGDVEVQMSEVVLNCEILTVRADETDPSRILSGRASGHVVLVRGDDRVEAGEAEFDLAEGTVHLTGLPRLTRSKTMIEAEKIVYSMEKGTASFLGPVKALFEATGDRP